MTVTARIRVTEPQAEEHGKHYMSNLRFLIVHAVHLKVLVERSSSEST